MRNRWKKGVWLIIDSESGMTRYSDQVKKDYTGLMVTSRYADYEQPQDFIKADRDPLPIPFANPGYQDFSVHNCLPQYVGDTNIPTPFGPANHLFACSAVTTVTATTTTTTTTLDLITTDSGIVIVTDANDDIITG